MKSFLLVVLMSGLACVCSQAADENPKSTVPQNLDELWAGYDPRREPLETEVVKEWKEGDITFRFVLYTVGTFKGKKSRMLAYYAFPKSGAKLPGLLHLHGGGQSASFEDVKCAAQNGYAGMSLNWGGNKNLSHWKDGDPNTDWGALDATHPPQRNKNNHFAVPLPPDEFTLDAVPSPRNSGWYLVTLAARRALTFLEQQPEVDGVRLGVHGHSMGGRLTVELAGCDSRVKAAAPSCGGSGLSKPESALERDAVDTVAYLPRVTCPVIVISPTCDFHGKMDDFYRHYKQIGSRELRYSMTPHMNHRHAPEFGVCDLLWFEQHLKGAFRFPGTPSLKLNLRAADGVPVATLQPDRAGEVANVDIFYSTDPLPLTRFWRYAPARRDGDAWVAACPLMSLDRPLYVFANVFYPLQRKLVMHRDGKSPERFAISSEERIVSVAELREAGVKATDTTSLLIDDFSSGLVNWYILEEGHASLWKMFTRKLTDAKWRGPDGARLLLDVKTTQDNSLTFTVHCNDWDAFPGQPKGKFAVTKKLPASNDWQTVTVSLDELSPVEDKKGAATKSSPGKLGTWSSVTEFSLGAGGHTWRGPREFRNLRWELPAK